MRFGIGIMSGAVALSLLACADERYCEMYRYEISYRFRASSLRWLDMEVVLPRSVARRGQWIFAEWELFPSGGSRRGADSVVRFLFRDVGEIDWRMSGWALLCASNGGWRERGAEEDSLNDLLFLDSVASAQMDALVGRVRDALVLRDDGWESWHPVLWKSVRDFLDMDAATSGSADLNELLRQRRGDCTESALLGAALCRVLGLRARVAGGLLFTDSGAVWHSWAECRDPAGNWWHLDPALDNPWTRRGLRPPGLMTWTARSALLADGLIRYRADADSLRVETRIVFRKAEGFREILKTLWESLN